MPDPDTLAAPPLISVIVRSMDRPCLALALDSIALQEPTLEVVVVNARGPTHGPVPTTAGLHPVRRIDRGVALPRSVAANVGLDAATARWVIFLDDDDVFLPGHLARLLAAARAHPDAVAAYADVAYGRHGAAGWVTEHVFAADFDPLRLRFENFLPLHAVLVDRGSDALRSCRFDEQLDLFEDWDWWLQLARLGPFVRVPGVSARYVAADDGGSGVFADGAASARAREQLLLKWLARDSPQDQLQLLALLQSRTRQTDQAVAQLALARQTEADLRAMLQARAAEIAAALSELSSLRQLLAAREQDLAASQVEITNLLATLSARDQEIANWRVHRDNLQQTLEARDAELVALRARHAQLTSEPPLKAFVRAWRARLDDPS